ncbi:hypothetical protein DVR12_15530 [Chitinophaga silvatica]|uniref:PA14 domain-containing protein n=2 Tax=Chitinophaga silvatica TaxID=2282649 RepID=A0A3E1Y9M2_9BACT|nr:hypothetical protein DVR12_15530 [Chitinophaga silvatica]
MRAWALTSGPSQPEHKQFEPYSTSEMVDVSSGAFKYNIPLLDVDGYPLNLNYASGVGMDDEASWVGLGWNLNVGAINRQLRGIPDDFCGDPVTTKYETATRYTYGGNVLVRGEVAGGDLVKLKGSITLGVFSDSYNGMGAEFGANAGLSISLANDGMLTGGLKAGVSSNTSSGVDVTAGLSLDQYLTGKMFDLELASNLSYNTRSGFQQLTLGGSFGAKQSRVEAGVTYNYNTPPFYPKIGFGSKVSSQSYSLSLGLTGAIIFAGGAVTGYFSKQSPLYTWYNNRAYGYLYADLGTNDKTAVMDFMREKENPVIPNLPNLAVPVSTPDLFSYTNQMASGQFRLQRGNTGVVFDTQSEDQSDNFSVGADYGTGLYFHGGVQIYDQTTSGKTNKWKKDNNFLSISDYKSDPAQKLEEQAYFKLMGEQTAEDADYVNSIQGEKPIAVELENRKSLAKFRDKAGNLYSPLKTFKKTGRQIRNTTVSYLTAGEAYIANRNKLIASYKFVDSTLSNTTSCGPVVDVYNTSIGGVRRINHISEITVTQPDGKRAVYGLPVYNLGQEEYTFNADPSKVAAAKAENLLAFDTDTDPTDIKHNFGKTKYYQRQQQSAYATSYLLTAILSPDYVDVTGDGITDDDLGTAIKFNYSKVDRAYGWRTPVEQGKAFFNRGLNADTDDDKGMLTYGQKELWYLNSIETKTKIAYFILGDRLDANGVSDVKGTLNTSVKQKCLNQIRLYSKTDLQTPIKTVNFKYNYNLCPGTPNSTATTKGKLTLETLYFTYGSSTKGRLHPYKFNYEYNASYAHLSTDRWGTYKPTTDKNNFWFKNMNNDEYPYTIQDTTYANKSARTWNLNKITLPTGGTIGVDYESGDYAYVQDRKAMQMVEIKDIVKDSLGASGNLLEAKGIKVTSPGPLRGANDAQILQNFVDDYLNGRNDFYVKMNVNVTDNTKNSTDDSYFDNVICYAEITKVRDNKDGTYNLMLKDISEGNVTANPIIMAAWQKMRLEYPKYAYPGYEDRIQNETGIERAITALVHAIGNLAEIGRNFNERARNKKFATVVNLKKSYARLVKADGIKLGGSTRVKRILMRDQWNALSGGTAASAVYGQEYEYRTTEGNKTISSGVAAYEPGIGGDENPMHLPVQYSQVSKGTLTNFFYLEEPFGESLFPAPQIIYSKVIVRDIDATGKADPTRSTGWIQSEFYTAKDYPVIIDIQGPPIRKQNGPTGWANFTGANQVYELAMSQGYAIWLNDMHGKPKAERVFNQSGSEISSTVTYYKSDQLDADKYKLNNTVATIDATGTINQAEVIGREIEVVADMREQETRSEGKTIALGVDVFPLAFWVVALPHFPRRDNNSYKLFRSASVLKTIQQVGIVEKVVKTINGSTVSANNLVFDRITGQPVVTSTQNEYNDLVYSVSLPAWWKYNKMSGAFKNINTMLLSLTTDANGVVTSNANILTGGDELIEFSGNLRRLWIINSPTPTDQVNRIRLIDDAGNVQKSFTGNLKIVRSGYRNQLGANAESIVTLKNPIAGNKLAVLTNTDASSYKVLDAKAYLYEEEWGPRICNLCPPGYTISADGTKCEAYPIVNLNDTLNVVLAPNYFRYGESGGKIKKSDNSTVITNINAWGGQCPDESGSYFTYNYDKKKNAIPSGGIQSVNRFKLSYPCGRLNDAGITLKRTDSGFVNQWMGVETCFNVDNAGTYSYGYGVDDLARIYIDNTLIVNTPDLGNEIDNGDYHKFWNIFPITLTKGSHKVRIEFYNKSKSNGDNTHNYSAVAFEIYNATSDQLATYTNTSLLNTIFTTKDLAYTTLYKSNKIGAYILDNNVRRINKYNCINGQPADVCSTGPCDVKTPGEIVNPYIFGALGNWRVSEEKVYEVNRVDQQIFANKGQGLNLKNSGYLQSFKPYWYYDANSVKWASIAGGDKWVTSRYVTLYDRYGQELENKDALNRYSGALFGFKGNVTAAVAGNSMNREIYFDGFEDYNFKKNCGTQECKVDSFNVGFALGTNLASSLTSTDAHTGKYSIKLNQEIQLKSFAHTVLQQPGDGNYLNKDVLGQYVTKPGKGIYQQGFAPIPNKKYIVSMWVKDGSKGKTLPNVTLYVNNVAQTFTFKAIVEGWKQIETIVDMATISGASNGLTFRIQGTNALADDIRIFPYDATMKSYSYDESTLRLMAELDENNFATFYEYDDEGILIRVKKETDRGIVTLKETRSVLYKSN